MASWISPFQPYGEVVARQWFVLSGYSVQPQSVDEARDFPQIIVVPLQPYGSQGPPPENRHASQLNLPGFSRPSPSALVERFSACRCLYFQHAVDPCEAYRQRGHTVQEKIVLVGYTCSRHSLRCNGSDVRDPALPDSGYSSIKG
ncbi:hypothetical protein BO70DRAFT_430612 [Aspergillus heteromorphus CBS 117.55]|uniref:Uncharacterized protein n=1 Tax=Aspergillus heteromorphus CBS 117.55 TaxID=1448321 RepID=A0A317VVR5_9EURO|nr:uncharacterized protein BO70DRAFT_430612 [Aspergillus heteromorphus CBS 117.55]PWY77097.1 hypothetical protein BO70DRAFT_430612 [Aspergillus heteromorphus CBS 117.55]